MMVSKYKSKGVNNLNVEIVETEDKLCVVSNLANYKQQEDTKIVANAGSVNIYGVFDGHGWKNAKKKGINSHTSTMLKSDLANKIISYIYPYLHKKDDVLIKLRQSILDYDKELFDKTSVSQDGSTGIIVIQDKKNLYFANVGDSRAILFNKNRIKFETTDHKPDNMLEYNRIYLAGGQVNPPEERSSVHRANHKGRSGGLAVSRGFGDFTLKVKGSKNDYKYEGIDSIVSPEPDVDHIITELGDYLVLASDGLWDVMTSEDVMLISLNCEFNKICEILTKIAVSRGSRDNITVIVVKFTSFR